MSDRNQSQSINQKQRSRKVDSEDKLIDYIRMMLGHPMITVDVSDDQILLNIDETIRKFSDFAYGGEQTVAFVMEAQDNIQDYRLDPRVQAIKSVSWANSLGSINYGNGAGGVNLGPGWGTIGIGYVPHVDSMGNVSSLEGGMNGSCTEDSSGVAGGVARGSAMENMSNAYTSLAQRDTMQALFGRGVNFEFNSNTKILRVFEVIAGPFMIEASVEYQPNPDYDEIYNHSFVKAWALAATKKTWGNVVGKYSQSLVGGAEINYDRLLSEAESEMAQLDEDLLNKWSEPLGIFSG